MVEEPVYSHKAMSSQLLFSTNTFMKYHIQENYRHQHHFVWCSEDFDSGAISKYAPGSLVGPTSNPADIFRELRRDVNGRDRHSAKITSQKATLSSLAIDWETKGEITSEQKEEIIFKVTNADYDFWRPLLYVIPRPVVEPRLKLVPINDRASFGVEYIIPDLCSSEFEIVEL